MLLAIKKWLLQTKDLHWGILFMESSKIHCLDFGMQPTFYRIIVTAQPKNPTTTTYTNINLSLYLAMNQNVISK